MHSWAFLICHSRNYIFGDCPVGHCLHFLLHSFIFFCCKGLQPSAMFTLLKASIIHMLVEQLFCHYLALNQMFKMSLKFQHKVVNRFNFLGCMPKIMSISVTMCTRSMVSFSVRTTSLRLTTGEWSKWEFYVTDTIFHCKENRGTTHAFFKPSHKTSPKCFLTHQSCPLMITIVIMKMKETEKWKMARLQS